LISRYAKLFKGDICVVCTHIDDGVIGDEGSLIEVFEEELDDNLERHKDLVAPLHGMYKETKRLIQKINKAAPRSGKKTNKPNTRALATQQANHVELADLKRQRREIHSKLFADLVLTRNALVAQQLRKNLESSMPKGQDLVVHCVSSHHYAALKGKEFYGPRLSPEATGIPGLRAATLALAAPRLQATLEHYMKYTVSFNLESFQAWLKGVTVDCRAGLLDLARQPQVDLKLLVGRRLEDLAKERDGMRETLKAAIPGAKAAASNHINRKRSKKKGNNHGFRSKEWEAFNKDVSERVLERRLLAKLCRCGQTQPKFTRRNTTKTQQGAQKSCHRTSGRFNQPTGRLAGSCSATNLFGLPLTII
jgi:hypothetical protein